MIKKIVPLCCLSLFILFTTFSHAHFGMVIPSTNNATQQEKEIELNLSFSHPFEGIGMDLVKPKAFFLVSEGKRTDLLPVLEESQVMGHKSWKTNFLFKRPGVYQFSMEPHPYWEPAEDVSIIHYTKTVVSAFGDDQGWDTPAGLPTEIIPLLRPFGNYAGNSFSGQVLLNGKPLAGAEVEVEYYNENQEFAPPTDHHITQVVIADENGVFHFSCPQPGWWGFAALSEADYTLPNPDGQEKGVELGAVLWIYFDEFKSK